MALNEVPTETEAVTLRSHGVPQNCVVDTEEGGMPAKLLDTAPSLWRCAE